MTFLFILAATYAVLFGASFLTVFVTVWLIAKILKEPTV